MATVSIMARSVGRGRTTCLLSAVGAHTTAVVRLLVDLIFALFFSSVVFQFS